MSLELYIRQLEKVRKQGDDYYAICPIGNHSGKNRTLSIREKDGRVMAHCFSCGATTKDLARHFGIESEKRDRSDTPYYSEAKRMNDTYFFEQVMIDGYDSLKIDEKFRYREVKERMKNYKSILEAKYRRTLSDESLIILSKYENNPKWILYQQLKEYDRSQT